MNVLLFHHPNLSNFLSVSRSCLLVYLISTGNEQFIRACISDGAKPSSSRLQPNVCLKLIGDSSGIPAFLPNFLQNPQYHSRILSFGF
jgi:hypothetical protein